MQIGDMQIMVQCVVCGDRWGVEEYDPRRRYACIACRTVRCAGCGMNAVTLPDAPDGRSYLCGACAGHGPNGAPSLGELAVNTVALRAGAALRGVAAWPRRLASAARTTRAKLPRRPERPTAATRNVPNPKHGQRSTSGPAPRSRGSTDAHRVRGIASGQRVNVVLEGSERNVYLHAQALGISIESVEPAGDAGTHHSTGQRKAATSGGGGRRLGFLVTLVAVAWWVGTKLPHHTAAPGAPVSPLTFGDFDSKFSAESQVTDEQRSQSIAQLRGTRVRWQGILENVNGNMVDLQEKATTLTHDVALEVASDEESKLVTLTKGDLVTFEGTIEDYGTLIAHRLDDGRIIDSKHLSPDERATWLANSTTAALQPIAGSSSGTPSPSADGDHPQTVEEKAAWVRRQPGGGTWHGSDADLAHLYDNMQRATGN
jgi:hypothetical protein